MSDISVASMFCGLGGIDLAFTQAGFRVVWANDADREACLTYRHNFSATELYEGDIRSIGADRVPPADVLTAGFPCQSFSLMGHRRGFSDDRGKCFLRWRVLQGK